MTTGREAPGAGGARPIPPQHEGSELWARTFAAFYDRMFRKGEAAGMAERRRGLLAHATGRTVEIGAGTGLNLEHYPPGLELLLTEPDEHLARRLGARAAGRHDVVHAHAEALPLATGTADTAVATLVLCTVPDPTRVLDELARVLRPGGALLFIEHVHAGEETRTGRWQDRLERPWRRFGRGCRPNRRTEALLRGHPAFDVVAVEHAEWIGSSPLVRPLIVGRATRTA